jgi:DNA (cytosine-5)-methyltransferase 1
MELTYGSVCSGIEAATVAWHPLGWKPAWFSEIEPFPCTLLAHHYPTVPNLGDMTKLPARILAGEVEAPDVLCGGTPCQAFSVAGLRNSLDDARGNLSLIFCEVANAIDTVRAIFNAPPAVIFWENVPGVLNTKDNAFGCFLAGLAGEDNPLVAPGGKWPNAGIIVGPTRTVAWRVLDAQYFGVAQRRRRVFVIASAREGFDPAGILFEFEGVRWDTAPRREAGEEVTPTIRAGAANGGAGHGARSGDSKDELIVPVTGMLSARNKGGGGLGTDFDLAGGLQVAHSLRGEGFDASEDGTGRGTPLVPVTFACGGIGSYQRGDETSPLLKTGADLGNGCETLVMSHGQANAEISVGDKPTLNCNHEQPIVCAAFDLRGREGGAQLEGPHDTANIRAASGGSSRSYVAVAFAQNTRDEVRMVGGDGQIVGALSAQPGTKQTSYVATAYPLDLRNALRDPEKLDAQNRQGCGVGDEGEPSATLTKAHVHGVVSSMQVRRLTPTECERLQGFDDSYTLIPVKKVSRARLTSPNGAGYKYREIDGEVWQLAANGPRYKALGNSWAVPVVRWLGGRIDRALAEPVVTATPDSLESLLAFFDVPDSMDG